MAASEVDRQPHILVVDDEPAILESYREIFDRSGPGRIVAGDLFADTAHLSADGTASSSIDLLTASQGEEAVRIVREYAGKEVSIQVVFLDIRMPPGIDGLETARQLREIDRHLQIVIVTAYSDYPMDVIIRELGRPTNLFYLAKPFAPDEVRQMARSLVHQDQTRRELGLILSHFMQLSQRSAEDRIGQGEVEIGAKEVLLQINDLTGAHSSALVRESRRGRYEHLIGTGLLESGTDLNRARQNRVPLHLFSLGAGEDQGGKKGKDNWSWAVFLMRPEQSKEFCRAVVRALLPYLPHLDREVPDQASTEKGNQSPTPEHLPGPPEPRLVARHVSNEGADSLTNFHGIFTADPGMEQLFEQTRRVARHEASVFISGETGTGKELIAKAIHLESSRRNKAFVSLNCANLTEHLLESQLFGHKKGAFTGAVRDQPGLLAEAEGGTLFMDEVTEIPLPLQAKLLRVLQEREYTPVGDTRPISFDVKLISASQVPLKRAVQEGRFRQDLQFRLQVIPLALPPLRDRSDDRCLLFEYLLRKEYGDTRKGEDFPEISPEVWQTIRFYDFPGNVREMQNIVAYIAAMAAGPRITLDDLPQEMRESLMRSARNTLVDPNQELRKSEELASDSGLSHEETPGEIRDRILQVLRQTGGNQSEAARRMGISRMTLWRKMKDLGLRRPDKSLW